MEAKQEQLCTREGQERAMDCLMRHIRNSSSYHARFSDPHYHEYIELLYGMGGEAKVLIGDRVYTMAQGDLLVAYSGEIHDVSCERGETSYYVIKFLPKLLYGQGQSLSVIRYLIPLWQKQVKFRPAIRRAELADSRVDEWIREIQREWEGRSAGYEMIAHANVMQIFVWILRHCGAELEGSASLSPDLQSALSIALEETPAHLEDWSTREAAAACGLSYNYFSHTFKKAFGISYTAYLESVRLREAERLLLMTDMEITEIAYRIGFGSASYFIERFRKCYGTPPRLFRARMRA